MIQPAKSGPAGPLDEVVAPVVKLALADGNAAIGYVRKHAAEYESIRSASASSAFPRAAQWRCRWQ